MNDAANSRSIPPLPHIADKDLERAKLRYEIIRPALEREGAYLPALREAAKLSGLSIPQLYRDIDRALDGGGVCGLLRKKSNRKFRLPQAVFDVMKEIFDERYLSKKPMSRNAFCRTVQTKCHDLGTTVPCKTTIRWHLRRLIQEKGLRQVELKRGNRKAAERHTPRHGIFADYHEPLSLIQIDHTKLDIHVVDPDTGLSIGRAFITYIEDIYSRMVLGFYISLDPVGMNSVGLALYHAILSKDEWLTEMECDGDYPCHGFPAAIATDNAQEFIGRDLRRFCDAYDIRLDHRPVGRPHFGGHIERAIRTLNERLHDVPGQTGSNVLSRGDEDPEKWATLTLKQLEQFDTEFIVNEYHARRHRGLTRIPLVVYQEGILGDDSSFSVGRLEREIDRQRLRFDLLPTFKCTVQRTGVTLETFEYVGEVLGAYTNRKLPSGASEHFLVARDPRRINEVFFYAHDVNEYFKLTLRDPSRPDISKWEADAARKRLRDQDVKPNTDRIFASIKRQEEIVAAAETETKTARRNRARKNGRRHLPTTFSRSEPVAEDWDSEITPYEGVRFG